MIGVVAEPLEHGNHEFRASTRVAHGRKHLGVEQAGYAVRDLEIDPSDGNAITQTRDAFLVNL
jgi:hypothetical protein